MRKTLLILFINSALLHFYCAAQKFSLEPFVGYNIYPGGTVVDITYTTTSTGPGIGFIAPSQNIKGSFGQGFSIGVDASYKICSHVALNLGLSVLPGKKYTEQEDYNYYTDTEIFKPFAIKMLPGITFSFNEDKKIQPYIRTELAAGIFNSFKDESLGYTESFPTLGGSNASVYYDEVITKHGGISLGYGAALGVLFRITNLIGVTAEVNGIYQTYGFTKGQETSYNGVNTPYGTSYIYQDNINSNTSQNSSTAIALKQYYPFSSIGVRMGVRLMF